MFARSFRRSMLFAANAVAIALTCSFGLINMAKAQQDITPPALVDVTFDPAVIDTSHGPVTITVIVHVTDDLSGVSDIGLSFQHTQTTQSARAQFYPDNDLQRGDVRDGYFEALMSLPQYAAYGEWKLIGYSVTDRVGNRLAGWPPAEPWYKTNWSPRYEAILFRNGPVYAPPPTANRLYLPALAVH